MADFLTLPLNKQLYEVYMNYRHNRNQDYRTLDLFNEVYYISARIVLEDNEQAKLGDYIKIIKEDMGWNYTSSLVVNMVYCVLALRRGNSKAVESLLEQIRHHYRMECQDSPFSRFVKDCIKRGESYDVVFKKTYRNRKKSFDLANILDSGIRPIIQVQQAEINLYSEGNIIGKTIHYEEQRKELRRL